MNNIPRQKLRELIAEYGRSLCDDPRRCESLLKDYCGEHKREIFVLVEALKSRALDDFIKAKSTGIPETMMWSRARQRLEEDLAMTAEAAEWVVESWAFALGLTVPPHPATKSSAVSPSLQFAEERAQSTPSALQLNSHDTSLNSGRFYLGYELNQAHPADQEKSQPQLRLSEPKALTSSDTNAVVPISEYARIGYEGRYLDPGDGTVIDTQTNLQWMRCIFGQRWENGQCVGRLRYFDIEVNGVHGTVEAEIKKFNASGGYAKYRDWCLPTYRQLLSIVCCNRSKPKFWQKKVYWGPKSGCELGCDSPAIDTAAFHYPISDQCSVFLTSGSKFTTYGTDFFSHCWVVFFDRGTSVHIEKEDAHGFIRLVRKRRRADGLDHNSVAPGKAWKERKIANG